MKILAADQYSPEWDAFRLGKPSSSSFSKLVTSKGAASKSMVPYAQKLAGDLFCGEPIDAWEGNQYTERGHEVEDEARAYYSMMNDVEVTQVGSISDDMHQWLCSPDGLVGDHGILEIKCLPKLHIAALLYYKKNNRAPTDYIAQTQGQLLITERKWVDLLYYHPKLPKLTIRMIPDLTIQTGLKAQLKACVIERNITLKILKEFA
jgi:hypothetical protein